MALILLFHFNLDFIGIVGFFFSLEFRNCWHFPSLCVDFRVRDMNSLLNKIKTVFLHFVISKVHSCSQWIKTNQEKQSGQLAREIEKVN